MRPGPTDRRIGIFGGTFNPIHLGHLRAAEEVREQLGLARMLFVPAADPPLKGRDEGPLAPAEQRLAWVEAAVAGHPEFEASGVELERTGKSYTVDTLRVLAERHPGDRLVFVVGCDAFRELGSWYEPEVLLSQSDFAVVTRPPTSEQEGLRDWIPADLQANFAFDPLDRESILETAHHGSAGTRIERVAIPGLDISATDIRRRIRESRSIRYLVPEAIRESVIKSGAYAAAA